MVLFSPKGFCARLGLVPAHRAQDVGAGKGGGPWAFSGRREVSCRKEVRSEEGSLGELVDGC